MEAHQIRFSVHCTPAAARSARQQLVNGIRRWNASLDQDLLSTAELVAAELLTNAVRHAGHGPISAGARQCVASRPLPTRVVRPARAISTPETLVRKRASSTLGSLVSLGRRSRCGWVVARAGAEKEASNSMVPE